MGKAKSDLRDKLTIKAVRNVQRGYTTEKKTQSLFRPEIKLDLQRSRLITEAMKKNEGKPIITQQAEALAHVLTNMDIFIQDGERIVGYQTSAPNGLFHPIDMNWRSVQRLVNSEAGATLLDESGGS